MWSMAGHPSRLKEIPHEYSTRPFRWHYKDSTQRFWKLIWRTPWSHHDFTLQKISTVQKRSQRNFSVPVVMGSRLKRGSAAQLHAM